jgi:hypothetical protein
MQKRIILSTLFTAIFLGSCGSSSPAIVPLTTQLAIEDTQTIIWNGSSKTYRYIDGDWQRDETYDYQFDVIQKRYADTWKSVKSLHRRHPDYDGRAGARSQAMYFEVAYREAGDKLSMALNTSFGSGSGQTDKEFRQSTLVIAMTDVSMFAPYSHMRITQNYDYENGLLTEVVELFEQTDEGEVPYMKMEETAYFYLRGKLDEAPTVWE